MILNTIAFLILLFQIKVVVFSLIWLYKLIISKVFEFEHDKKMMSRLVTLSRLHYYSELYTVYIESFMEILIAAILTLKENERSPFGEMLAYMLVCFSLIIICI